jgi:hypothetical protein
MTANHDARLRDAFQALRQEDATGVPSFAATLAAARARTPHAPRPVRPRWHFAAAAAAVVASVLVVLLLTRRGQHDAVLRWEAPTDFLLQLPNADLLRTVPQLGRVNLEGRIL